MASNYSLNNEQLGAICSVLADTSEGLTKSELNRTLDVCKIEALDDGSARTQFTYKIGLSKKDWLFNCFAAEINKTNSFLKVFHFIETALNPIAFTKTDRRDKYTYLFDGINKVLLMIGLSVSSSGKIIEVEKAETLDEVDRRVNHLNAKLYQRAIHHEVLKYCQKDYLRKDYYDAVFEASKSLAARIRSISGETLDGSKLFYKVFNPNNPLVFINSLATESEKNEFNGLNELLQSITHLVRNTTAHTPKIDWKSDETSALDILTVISFAHKYLDRCYAVPRNKG